MSFAPARSLSRGGRETTHLEGGHGAGSRYRGWITLTVTVVLAVGATGCGDDHPVRSSTPESAASSGSDGVVRVVTLEVLTCRNRITRGVGVDLGGGDYLTAAHTVTEAASISVRDAGSTTPALEVTIDPRRDLALVAVEPDPPNPMVAGITLGEVESDRPVDLVTTNGIRALRARPEVIVRARRPDGSIREWGGVPLEGAVVGGESGSPLLQNGRVVGILVLAERRAARAYAVSSGEISGFLSELHVDTVDTKSDYSVAIQSGTSVNPTTPVGAACR